MLLLAPGLKADNYAKGATSQSESVTPDPADKTNKIEAASKIEGAAHGFPVLRDLQGHKLADGDFTQWLENKELHVRITFNFGGGHHIQEDGLFEQAPRLVQKKWSWKEVGDGRVLREFAVDFNSGNAIAQKWEENKRKHWSEKLKIQPGRTYAGFGFSLALKDHRQALIRGEPAELLAVAFTPKPRVIAVKVTYGGLDKILMGDRTLKGDCFIIHPKVPWAAKLFVNAPDTKIWLINPPPADFLRWEGQLVEPSDAVIRVDRLPGLQSGPAEPVK